MSSDSSSIKPRQTPIKPIHFLLDSLADLQTRMLHTGSEGSSMNVIEAADYFSREGQQGRNCSYYLKCVNLFKKQDYHDIKRLVEKVIECYRKIEGEENLDKK